MKHLLLSFILPLLAFAQNAELVTNLNESVNETSGLLYIDGTLITHNDSGGETKLFELDSLNGSISREVFITNSSNIDWEDLCHDDTHIYIADIGNNQGNRTNLKIYKISISDYATSDTVNASVIHFSYNNQSNFEPQLYTTNFDAEALISYNDSLYIFTKNWGNAKTNVYALPKNSGIYEAVLVDSINSNGLITGACYNPVEDEIILTGYSLSAPFYVQLAGFHSNLFSNGTVNKQTINVEGSFQVEAIASLSATKYYLTAEAYGGNSATLYRMSSSGLSITAETALSTQLFPNPASNILHIEKQAQGLVEIYNLNGLKVLSTTDSPLNISQLAKGTYIVHFPTLSGKLISKHLLIQ